MKRVIRASPVLLVRSLDEAESYYRDKLGFTISWKWGEPTTLRVGVSLDDIELQLVRTGPGAPPGPSVVYCLMTGVDSYYQECRARGATFRYELDDRPFGMRDFRVEDPSGNHIGFGEAIRR